MSGKPGEGRGRGRDRPDGHPEQPGHGVVVRRADGHGDGDAVARVEVRRHRRAARGVREAVALRDGLGARRGERRHCRSRGSRWPPASAAMSAAVCWLRFCANVEPPSSARPANPSSVIRDSANTTRTWPSGRPVARVPCPAAVRTSRLSLWSFDLRARRAGQGDGPEQPGERGHGGERRADGHADPVAAVARPGDGGAGDVDAGVRRASRARVPARAGRRASRSPRCSCRACRRDGRWPRARARGPPGRRR